MDRLEDLNGQKTAVASVLEKWGISRKEVVVVVGLPGSGITWVLEQAARAWEELGGAALQARGEVFAAERGLFPWLTLALPGTKRLARLEVLKGTVAHGSEAIPVVGSVASYLVEELLNYRKKRLAREAIVLTEQEQDLLFVIQTIANRKRLLLTLDHLEMWDNESWNLLGLVLSTHLHELYPVLSDVIILVGVSRVIPTRLRTLIENLPLTELKLRTLERRDIPSVVSAFGFPIMAHEDLDLLYDATMGRLDLLHDFALHLQKSSPTDLPVTRNDLYDNMIERRLQDLKPEMHDLEDVLAVASILGHSFGLDDIRCLTGYAPEILDSILRFALAEHFLNSVGEMTCFQSAALHCHFYRAKFSEHSKYHAKFAECLRAMRPGDYDNRLHHLILAGRNDEALTCYALTALKVRREHLPNPDCKRIRDIHGWEDVRAYLDKMCSAYDAYDNNSLRTGIDLLEAIEDFLPDALIAERDFLEAQFLLRSHRVVDFQRAVDLLTPWQSLKNQEGEIWSRLAQILMVAQVEINHIEEAHHLEEEVTKHYWSRRKVDPWALYGLNILRRRAECLHQFPVATHRLESALAYFGPQGTTVLPRNPIQYYYTLTNLVGNLLVSGRFNEAHTRALELDSLVHNYPNIPWPALEDAANNFTIAGYLSGNLDIAQTVTLMDRVRNGSTEMGDSILIQNNYAVLLIHAGRHKEAEDLLEHTYTKIIAGDESDAYHRYFIGSNLAALRALDGNITAAEHLRQESARGLDRLYPAIRQTLQKRHELLAPAFSEASKLGSADFDKYLITRHPRQLGKHWDFYGRGFLFSDIQFWSAE
jgi:hypothetical protein